MYYDHLSDEEFVQHYEHLFYKQEAFKRLQKYVELAEGRSFKDLTEDIVRGCGKKTRGFSTKTGSLVMKSVTYK